MKVYALIKDDYESSTLIGVFSSYELAEKYSAVISEPFSIDEQDLDPEKELVETGMKWWSVHFDEHGNVIFTTILGWDKPEWGVFSWGEQENGYFVRVMCRAGSEEGAIAIAILDYIKIKERGRWGTDDFEGLM